MIITIIITTIFIITPSSSSPLPSSSGLYPSTFNDPRFRKEDSVFVTHECSKGAKSLKAFAISAS
jgi:hypothetical protein